MNMHPILIERGRQGSNSGFGSLAGVEVRMQLI